MTLKKLKRYDSEERSPEERSNDRLHWVAQVFTIVCIVACAIWIHFISNTANGASARAARVQASQAIVAQEQAAEARKLNNQQSALIQACNRLNQVRKSDNTAHEGSFILFKTVIALSALSPPPPPAERHSSHVFLTQLRNAEKAQSWTPIQNCKQVIAQQGANFKIPEPIAFVDELPPASALAKPRR